MPLKVLKRHGVIEADGQIVSLTVPRCSANSAFNPSCRSAASAYGITVFSMKNRFLTAFVFWS
jgi:hypothetical protein